MTEDGTSSFNTELASGSLDEYDLFEIDVVERLDTEDLCALRAHFFPSDDGTKQKPVKYESGYKFSGLPIKKEDFVQAVDEVIGSSTYSLGAAKLFQSLDSEKRGVIWWEQLLDHLIDRIGRRDQGNGFMQPINPKVTILNVPHSKRESIVKVVPIETEKSFCYAIISKYGLVGVYDGQLQLCERYSIRLTGSGSGDVEEDENRRRIVSTWVTDAIYLPDAGSLLLVTSGRSIHVLDATCLIHAPLCSISGMKNSPQCLAYAPSSPGQPSMLFIGDDQGNITTMKFHQPKISLFRRKHPDKLDKYYWMEVENQSEWVSVSVESAVHSEAVRQIEYFSDNETIVSCSQDPSATLVVHHILGRRTPYIFKIWRGVRCFHMERELKLLVTGSNDGVVRLWNPVVTKQPVVSLFGHKSDVVDVLILNHMSSIVSCSADGVLKVWDIDDQCCTQTLQLNFPSFSVLGKTVEFGTRSLYPGPPNRAAPKPKLPSGHLSLSSIMSSSKASTFTTTDRWTSLQLLVACCSHIAILHLSSHGNRVAPVSTPLPPPSREHHPSVPSPWQAAKARGIITPDSSVYDQDESPPLSPTLPKTEVESTEVPEDRGNYPRPPSLSSIQYPVQDLNIRRTHHDRRMQDMHIFIERCAPYLALQLHEMEDLRFSRPLPVTNRMRERGMDLSDPERLIAGSVIRSTSISSLGSAPSTSRHGDRLTPDRLTSKSRK